MKTLDEMIAVMQAAKEGKDIQFKTKKAHDWCDNCYPNWNWESFDYRIKPEEPKPEYVPYETGAEFIKEVLKHKGWVILPSRDGKEEGDCYYPIGSFCTYDGSCMVIAEEQTLVSFSTLLHEYVWADDKTPCGKLKQ